MNAVQHLRKSILKVSQAGLAEIAKTTQATVSRWENGELSPDLDQLTLIREAVRSRDVDWDDSWFFDAPKVRASA